MVFQDEMNFSKEVQTHTQTVRNTVTNLTLPTKECPPICMYPTHTTHMYVL